MSHMVLSAGRLSGLTDDDLARFRDEPQEQMGEKSGGEDGRQRRVADEARGPRKQRDLNW
ncbi:hypothetical protein PILCRDRAFT_813079 [Piloderma croceum F 1598]|uniref:Uncharacterized protein n=1 Tax=Piloderma croceum (strain F 1598) TaxID=765440 RepID=A0A0C3CHB9_PILCF|nr:hypothetical protein PILCRDRAFT_813079 [Piloderma croceum F 1598]